MKTIIKIGIALLFLFLTFSATAQILDLESTTEGVLVPRMTTVQKEAIPTPGESLLVYDTDTKSFWFYENMEWRELATTEDLDTGFEGASDGAEPNEPIPDGTGPITNTITLADPGAITADTQIEVCVNIAHPYTGVVNISLLAPDGTTSIDLIIGNGGSGVNITNTCFTTSAIDPIGNAIAPFTGNFMPEEAFSILIGQAIAGDWVISVEDIDAVADAGTFLSWSIAIQNGEASSSNLLSDEDSDTRVLVEKAIDEDTIRVEIGGVETLKLSGDNAVFTTPVTASSFIGDGSQLTNLPSSSCNKYGDGSAGDLVISANTDWSTAPPVNGNFMFNDLTINAGQTLTVTSGTVIMVANNFVNNGTISVLPGIEGHRPSNHVNGPYNRFDGYVLGQFEPYPSSQLRFVINPRSKGGSSGEDGSILSTIVNVTQEGGSGGGTLIIRAANTLENTGVINAVGGNAIPHSDPTADVSGAGGGGGGFVILLGELIFNSGTINVNGGNGSNPGTGDDDHAGGGGGGGLVHFISSNANAVVGTVNISGGIGGVTPVANLGTTGGDGGSSAGAGGLAGTDSGGFVQPEPGSPGVIIRTQVADPCRVSYD